MATGADEEQSFLECIQEAQDDLDKQDPAAIKRLFRKVGAHSLKTHGELGRLADGQKELIKKIERFETAVFDIDKGLIVRQKQQIDRQIWTIRILGAIGAILAFVLATTSSIKGLVS